MFDAQLERLDTRIKHAVRNFGDPAGARTAYVITREYERAGILDGDLSPLLRGKHLARVSFQDRWHYSHRREEFGLAFTG
jgi:hypothetical protein